jgi:hypothetical protein
MHSLEISGCTNEQRVTVGLKYFTEAASSSYSRALASLIHYPRECSLFTAWSNSPRGMQAKIDRHKLEQENWRRSGIILILKAWRPCALSFESAMESINLNFSLIPV